MTLGEMVKNFRKEYNLSMDDFADRSGISKGYISMLEKEVNPKTGKKIIPGLDTIKKVSIALGKNFNAVMAELDTDQENSAPLDLPEKIEIGDDNPVYSDHEKMIIEAYRSQPDMQLAVDKLLGITKSDDSPGYAAKIKIAGSGGNGVEIMKITKSQLDELRRIRDLRKKR